MAFPHKTPDSLKAPKLAGARGEYKRIYKEVLLVRFTISLDTFVCFVIWLRVISPENGRGKGHISKGFVRAKQFVLNAQYVSYMAIKLIISHHTIPPPPNPQNKPRNLKEASFFLVEGNA